MGGCGIFVYTCGQRASHELETLPGKCDGDIFADYFRDGKVARAAWPELRGRVPCQRKRKGAEYAARLLPIGICAGMNMFLWRGIMCRVK
jgi:hypothetical protein